MPDSPIDALRNEHHGQREVLQTMLAVSESLLADRAVLERVLGFVRDELPAHTAFEDRELQPMLRRRAEPEDEIERLIACLDERHVAAHEERRELVDALAHALATSGQSIELSPWIRDVLFRFADQEKRHLTFENAIVLPLAAARLTSGDLENLRRRMHEGARAFLVEAGPC